MELSLQTHKRGFTIFFRVEGFDLNPALRNTLLQYEHRSALHNSEIRIVAERRVLRGQQTGHLWRDKWTALSGPLSGVEMLLRLGPYMGTSLIRNNPLLEPYTMFMSRALWWS